MDELSDYTSPVIEFKATFKTEKQSKLIDNSTATDPLPLKIDVSLETHQKCSQETQTVTCQTLVTNLDERKLAVWLQKIYPSVEKELLKGCTPIAETDTNRRTSKADLEIQPYQKLTLPTLENSQGLAIWLSVYTNNAPILVVTTIAPHDDWCEHVDQYLKLYIPKRIPNGNFVTYSEIKTIPIKSCLKSLCTNPFNKNIFAGSTLDGDIYIWKYEQNFSVSSNVEIKELHNATLNYGYAVAIDWSNEQTLLTVHTNGYIVQWHLGKELMQEAEYFIKTSANESTEICTLLALSLNDFVVGSKDGTIYHCWISSLATLKRHLEIVPLKKHLFMTSSLLKSNLNGHTIVISCDLSGQVYFHDLRNSDDDSDTVIAQIPLPFTNVIACSRDGSIIYSPGEDGSLECYGLNDGLHFTIKGALKGKGNFIKSSDNGNWIITGLYENEFQLFSIEN